MNEDLAKVLGVSLEDITAAHPTEVKSKEKSKKLVFVSNIASSKNLHESRSP